MSIRITQNMLFARALNDIQSGLFRFSQLQQEVSTGRRVNRPSDDPAAALRILPLRSDLRDLEQLGDNVSLARETLNTSSAALEDASAVMSRVRELTTQASNGTLSDSDRQSIASEVDQLLDQILGIANSRRGDRYLFGGTNNGTQPFSLVTEGGRTRPVYNGNRESLDIDVAPGVTTALNIPGDSIFLHRDRAATTFFAREGSSPTGAQPYGAGDTGVGFGRLQVTFGGLTSDAPSTVSAGPGESNAVGELSYTFTSSPDTLSVGGGPALAITGGAQTFTTADGRRISLDVTGVPSSPAPMTGTFTAAAELSTDGGETSTLITDFTQQASIVRNSFDDTVLYVDVTGMTTTGTDDVRFNGTFDVFTTLSELADLLRNDDQLSTNAVRDLIGDLLPEISNSHDAVLDGLRELGFRGSSMDVLQNRVDGLRISSQESLSRVEDTDMAEAILELQRQDLSYQTALQMSARVLQTSLQGFLR